MAAITMLAILLFVNHALGFDLNADIQDLHEYDYLVIGCGISGLVVTNRLSEDKSISVLCIEAGVAYVHLVYTYFFEANILAINMNR